MIRIAVLSDPHLHDVEFGGAGPLVRSLAETIHSTRVFNESAAALRQVLDDVAAAKPDLCLIVGDLTDDGQPASWAAVAAVLAGYRRTHGTRFFATPGNHDQWALAGKPLSKEVVDAGGKVATVAGEPAPGADLVPDMRMVGYAGSLSHAAAFGYCRDPADLHWETPFGTSDRIADRSPGGLPDLSYLVEPLPGLWLLSIDANVYRPEGDGFADRSKDGWTATLTEKPHLLPWMTDVAARAQRSGKRLVAFSHYPAADIFSGSVAALDGLDAQRAGRRAMPGMAEMAALADTGIGLHFSGHFHVDATAADPSGRLVNVAVPSTVAFPAGWKLLDLDRADTRITTRTLGSAPGFDRWHDRYRAEVARRGDPLPPVIGAPDYGAFLDRHFAAMTLDRRLDEDWPPLMRDLVLTRRLSDLPGLPDAEPLPMTEVFTDWYRLRETGGGSLARVSEARRALYLRLAAEHGRTGAGAGAEGQVLAVFFSTLGAHAGAGARGMAALATAGIATGDSAPR
jgi:3',5'-cyclic AMP phosphodiesterase CpdA